MGVEPFLLSSSLIGVLAQRLVRVLDPTRRKPHVPSAYECQLMDCDPEDPPTIFRPLDDGSYAGRTGIYELVAVDSHMRTMIHDGAAEHELERYARQHGPSIRADGVRKVLKGTTTLEEVLRATQVD
jgi:general secretion pathway protein E